VNRAGEIPRTFSCRTRNTWSTRRIDESSAASCLLGADCYSASAKLPALGAKDRVAVIGCGGGRSRRHLVACEGSEELISVATSTRQNSPQRPVGAKTDARYAIAGTVQKLQGIAERSTSSEPVTAALGSRAAKGRALRAGPASMAVSSPSAAADRRSGHRHNVGSYVGNLRELKEVVALAKNGKLKPIPGETRAADQRARALET